MELEAMILCVEHFQKNIHADKINILLEFDYRSSRAMPVKTLNVTLPNY